MLKRFLILILCALILGKGWFFLTDDFHLGNINGTLPYDKKWEVPPLKQSGKTFKLLQQPYTYFGKGAQCYAFLSQDGTTILKFFKFKHLRPPIFASTDYLKHLEYKKHSLLDGHHLAYTQDRQYSGLLYVHFYPTPNLLPEIHITDKLGLNHTLDINHIPFILQKCGKTLRQTLRELLDENNLSLAQTRIQQVLDMYLEEYQKGLYDRDHGILHNTGFIGNQPFHLDVGKLTYDPNYRNPEAYRPDLEKAIQRIEPWLKQNYPLAYPLLMEGIARYRLST